MKLIFPIVLMAVFLAYTLYVLRKRKAGMGPAFRMFFERTGYRYADILDAPLEQHIMHGAQLVQNARRGYRIHMVRDFHGVAIHNIQETGPTKDGGWFARADWVTPVQRASVVLQIADRSLSGAGKAIKEAFSRSKRKWSAIYSQQVQLGDADLDKRFVCFGEDPAAVQRVLATPGLKELLCDCAEVDLAVKVDEIRFADPMQKNMTSGMGGTIGTMALSTNMMKTMELTIPVHDRMAQLLATLVRACT